MRFSKRFLASLLLFVIQWIGAGQGSVNAQDAKPRSVRLPITLEADQHTELHARVQGYVEKVHVDIGDRVTKEQLLVTLDAPELEADVQRHKQMVMQAQANLGVAIGGVTVAEARLRQAGSGSRSDLDLQALWEIENLG
ncbi:MAG: efflux RND transporter periplasmic adaptor subunit, partial [Rubripirellula sp.]